MICSLTRDNDIIWSCWIKHWVLYRSYNVGTQAVQVTDSIHDFGVSKILWNVHVYQTTWEHIPDHSNHCVYNVYFFICKAQFLDFKLDENSCEWGLCVCHLWQGYVCVNVRHRNTSATLSFIGHAHVTVLCLSVFLPQIMVLAHRSMRLWTCVTE